MTGPDEGNVRQFRRTRGRSDTNGHARPDSIDLGKLEGFDPEDRPPTPPKADKPKSATPDDVLAKALTYPTPPGVPGVTTAIKKQLSVDTARKAVSWALQPPAEAFDVATLGELQQRPPEPPGRILGLMPWNSMLLLAAMAKAGKTTLLLNLVRCLLTGDPFLGRFQVQPVEGTIAFMNYELHWSVIMKWARQQGIDQDRLILVNLRGRRNPLAYSDDREALATVLRRRQVESVIVDPFTDAFTGESQNDGTEVGRWIIETRNWIFNDVGALDFILSAHTGWEGERAKGSTELIGKPDTFLNLVRPKDPRTGKLLDERYISGEGRIDEPLAEDLLNFDPITKTLTLSGSGSRAKATASMKAAALETAILDAISEQAGINGSDLTAAVRGVVPFRKGDEQRAVANLARAGMVRIVTKNRAKTHFLPSQLGATEEAEESNTA